MELSTKVEADGWPRDFDFRAEVAEQQELLEQHQERLEQLKESDKDEQN